MTRSLSLIFLVLSFLCKGQSCVSTYTYPASDIYYPNTTSNYVGAYNRIYLCGPNTIVYDTTGNGMCHYTDMNSGSILIFKKTTSACSGAHLISAKNNCTITVLPGTLATQILHEPSVVINNLAGSAVFTSTCANITYPVVNCSSAGINEIILKQIVFKNYPNPSSSKINIELINSDNQTADVRIVNQIGEVVYENKQWTVTDKEILIDNISNGSYFIQVKTKLGQQTEKLILIR